MTKEQFGPEWRTKFEEIIARFRRPTDRIFDDGFQAISFKERQYPGSEIKQPGNLIMIYPGVSPDGLAKAQNEIIAPMPRPLAEFLLWSNGLKMGPLSLHGTKAEKPQPVSLLYQNIRERYEDQAEDTVGLGGLVGQHSIAHYFLHCDGHVDLVAGRKITDIVETWPSYEAMVLAEVRRLSRFFDDDGNPLCTHRDMLMPRHLEWESICEAEANQ